VFLLRSVREEDWKDLLEMGQEGFINLPPNEELVKETIKRSLKTFESPHENLWKNYYVFVVENLDENKVVGVSMIHGQHGTEKEPHFYLKVDQEHKYSETINTGFVHGTLKLNLDTDGPTEIGGLIIDPEYRKHPAKLGKQISYIRFLYMAMNSKEFKETVLSELMPPLKEDGSSPLWEAVGKKFMNMDYHEADRLSRKNKEFILSLFPSEVIYVSLLPFEARDAIGKVGKNTEPAKRMLESIGFEYTQEVDPFDGGPHFQAKLKEIEPVRSYKKASIKFTKKLKNKCLKEVLLNISYPNTHFAAVKLQAELTENKELIIEQEMAEKLFLEEGKKHGYILL